MTITTGGEGHVLRVQPYPIQHNRLVRICQAAHLAVALEPALLPLEKEDKGL